MTSDRPYQDARTIADALAECRAHAGTHFCPVALQGLERLLQLDAQPHPQTRAA